MRRFIVDQKIPVNSRQELRGEVVRHIATVLRLSEGDSFILADGKGNEALATIAAIGEKSLTVDLTPAPHGNPAESPLSITIYQALPKGDKLEEILQKCTELGVASLVFFTAARSISRLDESKISTKLTRWCKIAQEAARQSGRSLVPEVRYSSEFIGDLGSDSSDLKLILWEDESRQRLKELLEGEECISSVAVIVGPEGGLTMDEVEAARREGFTPVTLGKRILRTETAAPAISAILQFSLGDIG